MSRTKVAPHRHSWPRLGVLLLISATLTTFATSINRWTSWTGSMPTTPNAAGGSTTYHVAVIALCFLILPCLLIALSWSEQRWWYAGLETLAVWLGMLIPSAVLASPVLGINSLWDVLAPCLAMIVIYLPARYLGLAFVRMLLFSIVYGQGLCTGCGYNLTGNTSGICPECGFEITRRTPETERTATVRER